MNQYQTQLPEEGIDLAAHLKQVQLDLLNQALERADWSPTEASRILRIKRSAMSEKMRRFQLKRPVEAVV